MLGIGIGAYILANQRLRFPLVEDAALHRQGRAAGRAGGHAGPGPDRRDRRRARRRHRQGRARGRQGRRGAPARAEVPTACIREDATALLRAKTGPKDMFLEVDPGEGKPLPDGGRIQVSNTLPDIDPDEFLAALDSDTRDYLKLLITGAGKGLDGRGTDLREVLQAPRPLHRDLARVSRAVADRRHNMRRLDQPLRPADGRARQERQGHHAPRAHVERDARRVRRRGPEHLGARVEAARHARTRRPPRSARSTRSRKQMGPTFESLRPPFRKLDDANAAVLPFVKEAAPILEKKIRPFARDRAAVPARPRRRRRRTSPRRGPDLTTSFRGLNRFFNIGAYNPGGTEGISEGCETKASAPRRAGAQRGLPVLARLGRPEHRLAVLDGRRARPDPARLPAEPELRHLQVGGHPGRHGGARGGRPDGSLRRIGACANP